MEVVAIGGLVLFALLYVCLSTQTHFDNEDEP